MRVRFCMLRAVSPVPYNAVRCDAPFLYDVSQYPHHAFCLLICKAFLLQALNKLKRVEVVILALRCGGAEVAAELEGGRIASREAVGLSLRLQCT